MPPLAEELLVLGEYPAGYPWKTNLNRLEKMQNMGIFHRISCGLD